MPEGKDGETPLSSGVAVDYDLIIVGGGLAGSSLAIALAGHGVRVLIVEQQEEFRDRIRGEVLMPWGSLEAKHLGIYDLLLGSCAIEAAYFSNFTNGSPPVTRDLPATTPAATCCLTFPHPEMQAVLLKHAETLGAEVRRRNVATAVTFGEVPRVHIGEDVKGLSARLVVLANGRDSRLRSLLGFEVQRDPEQLVTAGMILEGDVNCSEFLAGEARPSANTVNLFYDPAGGRMVVAMRIAPKRNRIYLIYHKDVVPKRLSGRHSLDEMIRQLQAVGAPGHWFDRARQAGPFASFDGSHRWVESPFRDGVVLVGDTAAATDPAWGRGLSRTLRDVRLLRDRLLASSDWRSAAEAYARDHDDFYGRMRRLEAMQTALLFDRGEAADRRRQHAFSLFARDPTRVPDAIGLGPEAPSDDQARALYFGEI
ncbi:MULTISPECIES: NAD(P)/FAD-dependent oxidoreductase [unclassified Mesorhizobium]|uniref:FAD-dependent oxidoreductase n=1 Tax=unclassified Mesorhizobium TaxID=325217 RepID=UPI000FD85C49|nr:MULTISPECIES: NAD(P)/FAD-dependent oxidoreductase [unclassified Mesorhizobium]TGT73416.1 FAD-dependent monooxygenase [Mesorhizobium sp. M2E.F.Ca.ET.166.01.1.1]TGV99932.1 FAD-dependent monooxygenase [Mesorhizobium sp. M2E.F.Ca.ET.154.01.1.1]